MDEDFETYFLIAAAAWLVLQVSAVWRMRGGWRWAACVSAAAMALALAFAVLGGLAGSNISPILVILALPVCLGWIVLLWVGRALSVLMGLALARR